MKFKKQKRKRPYLKQKLNLYFDANFPQDVVSWFKTNKYWKNKCKVYSCYDEGFEKKADKFHFNYCRKKKLTLVTLDDGFLNHRKFPFSKMPGIVVISTGRQKTQRIAQCLHVLLNFLSFFPLPRNFVGDTKFQLSPQACIIRGRDAITRQIKTLKVVPGDSALKVREKFSYMQK